MSYERGCELLYSKNKTPEEWDELGKILKTPEFAEKLHWSRYGDDYVYHIAYKAAYDIMHNGDFDIAENIPWYGRFIFRKCCEMTYSDERLMEIYRELQLSLDDLELRQPHFLRNGALWMMVVQEHFDRYRTLKGTVATEEKVFRWAKHIKIHEEIIDFYLESGYGVWIEKYYRERPATRRLSAWDMRLWEKAKRQIGERHRGSGYVYEDDDSEDEDAIYLSEEEDEPPPPLEDKSKATIYPHNLEKYASLEEAIKGIRTHRSYD